MSDVTRFMEMNHGQGILYLVAAILVAVSIIKAVAYIAEKFGLKTKAMIREEEQDADIESLKKQQSKICSDLDDIKDLVTVLSTSFTDLKVQDEIKETKRIRREILNFSDSLRSGNKTSKESMDDILEMYDDYEAYIREHKLTNGRMSLAIEYIKEYYRENF